MDSFDMYSEVKRKELQERKERIIHSFDLDKELLDFIERSVPNVEGLREKFTKAVKQKY